MKTWQYGSTGVLVVLTALFNSSTYNVGGQTSGAYSVVDNGANYRVWQKTTVENGANRVHRYTPESAPSTSAAGGKRHQPRPSLHGVGGFDHI